MPLRTPSMNTAALPWLGPFTVHQVMLVPVKVYVADAVAVFSRTKLPPYAALALPVTHSVFTLGVFSCSVRDPRKFSDFATSGLPDASCTALASSRTV